MQEDVIPLLEKQLAEKELKEVKMMFEDNTVSVIFLFFLGGGRTTIAIISRRIMFNSCGPNLNSDVHSSPAPSSVNLSRTAFGSSFQREASAER